MNNVRWTVVRNSYNSQQCLKKLGLPGSLFIMDASNTKPSLSFLFPPFLAQNIETYMFLHFVQGTVNKPSPYPPPPRKEVIIPHGMRNFEILKKAEFSSWPRSSTPNSHQKRHSILHSAVQYIIFLTFYLNGFCWYRSYKMLISLISTFSVMVR